MSTNKKKNTKHIYPIYKDSGIDCLSEIPEHWDVKRLKYLVICNENTLSENTAKDFVFNYIEIGDVSYEGGITNFTNYTFDNAPSRARRIVYKNDVIISTVRTYLKAITTISEEYDSYVVSTGFAVLTSRKIHYKYLSYFVQTNYFIDFILSYSKGVSYPSISISDLLNISCFFPSSEIEQQDIADFLDRKTEQIDLLVEKKKRLIELLEEERIAIINHAVTKGLNKLATMKDSGIEWLGEIPAHWDVKRLAHFGMFYKGSGVSKADLTDTGIPVCLYGDIYTKYNLKVEEFERRTSTLVAKNAFNLETNDLLFTSSGETKEDIGKCIVFIGNQYSVIGGDVIVFRQNIHSSIFLSYVFNSHIICMKKARLSKGEIVVHLYPYQIKTIHFPLPSFPEQLEIVEYLDKKTGQIDEVINKTKKEIELLQEYKTALINEVVTGKIDVRKERKENA